MRTLPVLAGPRFWTENSQNVSLPTAGFDVLAEAEIARSAPGATAIVTVSGPLTNNPSPTINCAT